MEYRIYRQDLKIEGDTAIEKIEAEEVRDGYVLEVTHMMLVDITTAAQDLELGYVSQVGVDNVLHIDQASGKKEIHLTGRAWIMAGEKPYGRVTTAVDGDAIYFSCHGKLWPVE